VARYRRAMRAYYEELWERLPVPLTAPDLELRRRFLLANMSRGERVLDLGCGDGRFTAIIAEAGAAAVGIEVAQAAVDRATQAHPELDFRLAEIDGPLPLADNTFDLVFATEVIEHVADTARWLSEARRVLAPRGRLLLSTPSHGRLRLAIHGIERYSEPLGDHLHLYSKRSLADTLTEFGFGEVEVRTAGGPPGLRRVLLARAVR
jgi:SAM-dependent methyltransferase